MAVTIESVLAAIKQHESRGDYTIITAAAKNDPRQTASGAYQMTDSTWRGGLQQAGLGHLLSQYPRAYLAPPDVQDKVARSLAESALRQGGGDFRAIPAIWYEGKFDPSGWGEVPEPGAGNTSTVRSFVDYVMTRAGDPNAAAGATMADTGGQFGGYDKPAATASDDEIIAYIQQHYGAFAWALGNPQLKDILLRGHREGWSEQKMQAEVQNSDYYKTTSNAQRNWNVMYATDPGEAARQLNQMIDETSRLARMLGISISRERVQMIAWNAKSLGWEGPDLQRALLDEANWNGKHIGEFGTLGATVSQVRQVAESYGLSLDRDRALRMARDILSGSATLDSITGGFQTQAKAMFPAFAKDIDAGVRLSDIAAPYMQTAADLLEINPATMRLTDPKWAMPLTRRQNGTPAPMSLDEWTTHVMSDKKYGWDQTNNAMGAAASFVQELGNMFGVF